MPIPDHEIKELIIHAAATTGQTVSAFLIGAAQERAKQVLSQSEMLMKCSGQWKIRVYGLEP